MSRIILFGGTTEGRILAEELIRQGIPSIVCVATEYGEALLRETDRLKVLCGRLNKEEMESLVVREKPELIIDATHPYAIEVTDNIRQVAMTYGIKCIRIVRPLDEASGGRYFDSMKDMIDWLNEGTGIIYSTLGVKEAAALTAVSDYKKRLRLRVLPFEESISECEQLGYPREHIIDRRGPFTEEENVVMFGDADIMITKESGSTGGFLDKLNAAKSLNMEIGILRRPREEQGVSLNEAIRVIEEYL